MRDYFDRIEDHLLDAVDRQGSSATWRFPGLTYPRQGRLSAVLAAALVLSAVVVAGVFLSSVRSANPGGNRSTPSSGLSPTSPDGSCGTAGAKRIYRAGVPQSLLSILGVLRRPQTPRDLPPSRVLPHDLRGFGPLDAGPVLYRNHVRQGPGVHVKDSVLYVYRNYIRLARVAYGLRYYLVPEVAGADVAGTRRCVHPVASIFLQSINRRDDGGGAGAITASSILDGEDSGTSGSSPGTIIQFLVPDEVATVTMRFPVTTNKPAAPHVIKSVTIKPVGNVIVFKFPANQTGRWRRAVWRSATGTIIPQRP